MFRLWRSGLRCGLCAILKILFENLVSLNLSISRQYDTPGYGDGHRLWQKASVWPCFKAELSVLLHLQLQGKQLPATVPSTV